MALSETARISYTVETAVADNYHCRHASLSFMPINAMPVPYADRSPFRRIAAWTAGAYWFVLLLMMHVPLEREQEYLEATYLDGDKLTHFGAYGLFAVLLCWAFDERRQLYPEAWPRLRVVGLVGVIAVLAMYGIIDEKTQPWTGRDGNLPDYIADVIGATLGTIAYVLLTWWRPVSRQ